MVARHPRHWGKEHAEYNPIHYLALLERKPGALDYARPLEDWELPECFDVLRRRQEAELEALGTREFIKVLRLREHATLPELADAVEYALSIGVVRLCDESVLKDLGGAIQGLTQVRGAVQEQLKGLKQLERDLKASAQAKKRRSRRKSLKT